MAKNAIPCLGQLLAAFNHADWPSAVRPFNLLLRRVWCAPVQGSFATYARLLGIHARGRRSASVLHACSLGLDARAKVRRAAQWAIRDVLAGLQSAGPALSLASDAVLKLCRRVLPGPEAAAHAAAAAPSKKRQQAEEAIAAAVADALHLLGALKLWIALVSGVHMCSAAVACSAHMCADALLPNLYRLDGYRHLRPSAQTVPSATALAVTPCHRRAVSPVRRAWSPPVGYKPG